VLCAVVALKNKNREQRQLSMRDGGYYAIKGFDYQIDKTILEIVSCSDGQTPIFIEQIQDINADNFVMQIKYKETQKFLPSKIKAPIIQLLTEFIKCADSDDRIYYLYCYFLDKDQGEHTLTLDHLNKTLGNKCNDFTVEVREQFITNFVLVFSPDFQTQFDKVISQIKSSFGCVTHEEAVVHYSTIVRELRAVVVDNVDPTKRVFTKQQLTTLIANNKKVVFDSAFMHLMDEAKRFKFIQSNFVKPRKNSSNCIFIGEPETDAAMSLEKMIVDFIDSYYNKATWDIVPPTFIISDSNIEGVKKELIRHEIIFNDGYEAIQFSYNVFTSKPVINRKVASGGKKATDSLGAISFKIRLISFSTYESLSVQDSLPDMIYAFNAPDAYIPEGISTISIDCLKTTRIYELLK
jgi:hypothetical protein